MIEAWILTCLLLILVVTSEISTNTTQGNGVPLKKLNRGKWTNRIGHTVPTNFPKTIPNVKNPKPSRTYQFDENTFDVVIVGAGWAGTSAAVSFESEGGWNYKILEARDRIGGRSRTVTESLNGVDIPIDLGSNWIHETQGNPLFDIAQQNNIPYSTADENDKYYQENNNGPFDDDYVWSLNAQLFYGGFYPYQAYQQEETCEDVSLQETVTGYINQENLSAFDESILEMFINSSIEHSFAASTENLSLWWWNTYGQNYWGNDAFLYEGYTALFEAHAAPVQSKVETNAVVTKINYGKRNVKVTYVDKDGMERTVNTRKVLVTVPLGVLKAKSIAFQPKLPKKTRKAISQIGMGTLNKIVMIWNESDIFWPTDTQWFVELPQRESKFEFYNPISMNGGKPFIIGFVAGDDAVYLEEQFGSDQNEYESQMQQRAMLALRNMFGQSIPDPEKIVVTNWNKDPFSLGSYSYNKVGMQRKARKRLEKPVKRLIYFAGEAASPYYGSTHGAYLSGINAANKIMR